jgi:hypothetical protein
MRLARSGLAVGLLALLGAVVPRSPSFGDEPPPKEPEGADPLEEGAPADLPERIDRAIERGVAWLQKRQKPDGSWWEKPPDVARSYSGKVEKVYRYPAGSTSLALYTLLKCGVAADDAIVRRGFGWLKKNHRVPGTAYESSMALLAVTATADPHKKLRRSDAAGERVRLKGDARVWATTLRDDVLRRQAPDGWRYYRKGAGVRGGDQDLSSTQLAVLALFAGERAGLPVPSTVWGRALRYAMDQQEEDGPAHARTVRPHGPGWDRPPSPAPAPPSPPAGEPSGDRARGFAYIRGPRADLEPRERTASGGMTACGVGTLVMGRYILLRRKDGAEQMDLARVERSVFDGLAWLDANWSPFENPKDRGRSIYYLYCVERAMDVLGAARLGERSWYVEMADQLLGRQREDGHWDQNDWNHHRETYDTCFALLFLSRATRGSLPGAVLTPGVDGDPSDAR